MAGLVAPVIDRLRNGVAGRVMVRGAELTSATGVPEEAVRTLAMLRNRMPDGAATRDDLVTVMRYLPVAKVDQGIDKALDAGVLTTHSDGVLRFTDRGRAMVADLHRLMADIVAGLWAGHEERVTALLDLTTRALDAATTTAGPAFAVMYPPYEPAGTPPSMVLAERLTPLRFHRFDAHVAAWQAAGLTVEQIRTLPPGAERQRIEEETNRRAAAPYAALDAAERLDLLGGLGALPN